MIALLNCVDDSYYISGTENIEEFLLEYADYIGINLKVFEILVRSGEMSTRELVEYINRNCYPNEVINEIYEIGRKIF